MTRLPHSIYCSIQVRAFDKYAMSKLGLSGTVLMERAGEAAFELLRKKWPDASSIVVLVGVGNNGGDGYVIARLAQQQGLMVKIMSVGDTQKLTGDALAASQRLQSVGIEAVDFRGEDLVGVDVIVDAIFGIDLNRALDEGTLAIFQAVNALNKPVLAIDVPSGLHADSGESLGAVIVATVTLTYIGLKRGLYFGVGPEVAGDIELCDLSLPEKVYEQHQADIECIHYEQFKGLLKPRERAAHKGLFGHVLVIGGDHGMTGAVRMAAESAARCGAGLVSIGTRAEHAPLLNLNRPELMVHALEDETVFQKLAERATVLIIGPGLGQSDWAKQMLTLAIESGLPLIVDADALNLLSEAPQKCSHWILTPHVGEAARLLGQSSQEVQYDRQQAVIELQANYGGIVILKGADTLIFQGQTEEHDVSYLCLAGNPGMATGGMGDILTGVIASLLAQGIEPLDACKLGVCLHATAGDQAAKAAGQRGMLASDLMSWLRRLSNPTAS